MNICPGCGGVVGRDCFNVSECIQISQSNNYDFYHLERENEHLKGRIAELKRIIENSQALHPELNQILNENFWNLF